MFTRLFAHAGLSMERLRALVEVGACGSIVKATGTDPARQSLYSRQIKELEDFFQASLLERYGRGVRLTTQGRELARISRFFLLGLSNFQRGCLAETQTYRIGAGRTYNQYFVLPVLSTRREARTHIGFSVENVSGGDAERRLHELTLDFAVVTHSPLSRPLQVRKLGSSRLHLWVPTSVAREAAKAERAFRARQLPLVWAATEMDKQSISGLAKYEPALVCESFVEAQEAMSSGTLGGVLPDFIRPPEGGEKFLKVSIPEAAQLEIPYYFAWNPRLLRLNPHAARQRDFLIKMLSSRMAGQD